MNWWLLILFQVFIGFSGTILIALWLLNKLRHLIRYFTTNPIETTPSAKTRRKKNYPFEPPGGF